MEHVLVKSIKPYAALDRPSDPAAEAILQKHLDQMASAVIMRDVDRIENITSDTIHVVTVRHVLRFEGREQVKALFHASADRVRKDDTTNFFQIVKFVRFISPDIIVGYYENHRLRGSSHVEAPFTSCVHIHKCGDIWKQVHIEILYPNPIWEKKLCSIGEEIDPVGEDGKDMRRPVWDLTSESLEIAMDCLDETGRAYADKNFDLFLKRFDIPNSFTTFDGIHPVNSREDLLEIFTSFQNFFARNEVYEYRRECISARFAAPDIVQTTHLSSWVSHVLEPAQPYPATSILRLKDGVWKVQNSQYALQDEEAPCADILRASDGDAAL